MLMNANTGPTGEPRTGVRGCAIRLSELFFDYDYKHEHKHEHAGRLAR